MIRIVARFFLLLLAAAAACGGSNSSNGSASTGAGADAGLPADAGAPADEGVSEILDISLSQRDVHLLKSTSTAFAVTATHADGTRSDVTEQADARSSNTKIATVERGPGTQIQIHAQNEEGTATIVVTVGNLQQTCAVTVFSN
jgi:hypothetical protein